MLPFTSLNAVTSAGAGAEVDLVDGESTHALFAEYFGPATGDGIAVLEGSLDGTNWFNLEQVNIGAGYTNPLLAFTYAKLVRYVRATIPAGQYPAGATSVTAIILSGRS